MLVLIALSGNGQSDSGGLPSDSVTIHVDVANAIDRELDICALKADQLKRMLRLDSVRTLEVDALESKVNLQMDHIAKQRRWYKKKEVWGVVGFVVGVVLMKEPP